MYGADDGCDYNTLFVTILTNNKINLKIAASSIGWVNSNTFVGGRCKFAGDVVQSGTRHIEIGYDGQLLNEHRFYGMSLEGAPEYAVDSCGAYIYFDRCRWERPNPVENGPQQVWLHGTAAGCGTAHEFRGGYDLRNVAFIHTDSAGGTKVESESRLSTANLTLDYAEGSIRAGLPHAAIDARGGFEVPVANNGTVTVADRTVGLVLLVDSNTGNAALISVAPFGSQGTVIWQTDPYFSTTLGNTGTYNVVQDSSALVIENKRGVNASISAVVLKAL